MNKTDLMGKRVCVSKKFVRHYHGLERKWEVFETPSFYGWVVGFRTIKSGYVNYVHNEYDPTVFTATEYIPCVLICTNPYEKPVRVPVSEIEKYLT